MQYITEIQFKNHYLSCSMDPIGLGELTYSSDLMSAWVQSHAFKFADRLQINFQCRVTVCVKVDGGCDTITVGFIYDVICVI